MNLPNDSQSDFEQRVTDLEQLCGDILKNEEALIKLSQRHRFNLQQIIGAVNGLTLDMGDVRERFDGVEQALERYGKRFDRIERILDGHDKRFDRIERILDGHDKRLDRIEQVLDGHDKRLDRIEQVLDGHDKSLDRIEHIQSEIKENQREHGQLLKTILGRLPQPQGE